MMRFHAGQYFGSVSHVMRAGAGSVTRTSHAPWERAPDHYHEQAYLCLVTMGGFTERCGSRSAKCSPGSVVWHPAGDRHCDDFGPNGAQCINVELNAGWVSRHEDAGIPIDSWHASRDADCAWLMARILEESERRDILSGVAIEGLASALLVSLSRSSNSCSRPGWLGRVVERLHDDFMAVPSLAQLAAEAGVSRGTLARNFHRAMGCSIGEFVRRRRIDWACSELQRTPPPRLSELALQAGFADQAHFTRTFRRLKGMTPALFRRR